MTDHRYRSPLCHIPGVVGGLTWSSPFISSETSPEICDLTLLHGIRRAVVSVLDLQTRPIVVLSWHLQNDVASHRCPYLQCVSPVPSQLRVGRSAVLDLCHQTAGSVTRWRMRTGQLCFEGLVVAWFGATAPPHTDFNVGIYVTHHTVAHSSGQLGRFVFPCLNLHTHLDLLTRLSGRKTDCCCSLSPGNH